MVSNLSFFNGCFDKGRLKALISWSLINCGEKFTIELVENLKDIGFEYATQAGISLSIDDLKIPPTKAQLVSEAELQIITSQIEYQRGHVTAVEKFQQLIDTWHRTSETLKQNVIQHFRATDILNPVYMMAFSGARGNVSQVRQLVGMRGLMADPQGQIIDFPIRSNFREGLTLTEYVISCYGARKGLVDTALRTANSGYLTRRLVDVSQHVIVCQFDCGTERGILLSDMLEGSKILLSLQNRLIGRVLAENIYQDKKTTIPHPETKFQGEQTSFQKISNNRPSRSLILLPSNSGNVNLHLSNKLTSPKTTKPLPQLIERSLPQKQLIASKGEEISYTIAEKITKLKLKILVRSPLTCEAKSSICQLCYGWSLAHGNLVSLGEAVGILAAQSIGEPGTQLTMRTFHTGGVFSGDLMTEMRAPCNGVINFTEFLQGVLIRTPHGKIAFLTKVPGEFFITPTKNLLNLKDSSPHPETLFQGEQTSFPLLSSHNKNLIQKFKIPASTILFVRQGEFVFEKQLVAEFSSISTQTNQRIEAKHNLNSEIEGQVFFENVLLGVKLSKEGDIIRIAKKLGSIWILSGKIYQTMVPTSFFPKPGDLVDSGSVINQILVISPYTGRVQKNTNKKLFSLVAPNLSSSQKEKLTHRSFKNSLVRPFDYRSKVINRVSSSKLNSSLFQPSNINLGDIQNTHLNRSIPLAPWPRQGVKRTTSFFELTTRYKKHQNSLLVSHFKKIKTDKLLSNVISSSQRKNLSLSCLLLSLNVKTICYSKVGYFLTFWNNTEYNFTQKKSLDPKFKFYLTNQSSVNPDSFSYSSYKQNQQWIFSPWRSFESKYNWHFKPHKKELPTFSILPKLERRQSLIPNSIRYLEKNTSKSDLVFLSTSLKQEFSNSVNLKKLLYLQTFPRNYKTETGGRLFYDWLYFTERSGQIFWVSQESYIFDPKTILLPNNNGFTFLSLSSLSQPNKNSLITNSTKKWVTNNFPLLSKYNSQGKIITFSSKMSGFLQLKPSKTSYLTGIEYSQPWEGPSLDDKTKIKTTKIVREILGNRALIHFSPTSLFCKVQRLKTLFSKQFLKNTNQENLSSPIPHPETLFQGEQTSFLFFRRNPYILIKHKDFRTSKILARKKDASSKIFKSPPFGKNLALHSLGNNKNTSFYVRGNFNKFQQPLRLQKKLMQLRRLFKFEIYRCNKSFLNEEKSLFLNPKTPFLNSPLAFGTIAINLLKLQRYNSNKILTQLLSRVIVTYPFGINFKASYISSPSQPQSLHPKNGLPIKDSFEITIKSGWIYFPHNRSDYFHHHKKTVQPGAVLTDNIEFDQHLTYIECMSIPFFSIDNSKCYFTPFQLNQQNKSLKVKLNYQKFIQDFSAPLLKFSKAFTFSSKPQTASFFKKDQVTNLNCFLLRLEKIIFINKRIWIKTQSNGHLFTPKEIKLIKQGPPTSLKIGSDSISSPEKLYYIKNRYHRYHTPFQNKTVESNLLTFSIKSSPHPETKFQGEQTSFQKHTPENINSINSVYSQDLQQFNFKLLNTEKVRSLHSALKDNKTAVNKTPWRGQGAREPQIFYLTGSFIKHRNFTKALVITRIRMLSPNVFRFENLLPEQLVTKSSLFHFEKLQPSFITPNSCILIRKVKTYSIFKSQDYKKLTSITNQRAIPSYPGTHKELLTNSPAFNKQGQTKLFASFPSAYLQINPSFRFKNSKEILVTKELNIFEFFILLNIPKKFPFKRARVVSNTKIIPFPLNATKENLLVKNDKNFSNNLALAPWPRQGVDKYKKKAKLELVISNISSPSNKFFTTKYKTKLRHYLGLLFKTNRLEVLLFRKIENSSFMVPALKNKTTQFTNTKVVLHSQQSILTNNPLSLTDFFSPYQGEITDLKSDSLGKQSCFLLTEKDQLSFSTNTTMPFIFVGQLIRYGEQITENLAVPNSGQVIQVDKTKITLRKAHPILFSSKGVFYVHHGDFVEKNSPLLTLFYQRLKTGDIVQGIPKIEQLFEARQTKEGEVLPENLHDKLHNFFEKYKQKYSPQDAARKSLEKTQQLLVDGVQRVYQSQGVTIADKHLEVIVRQMTSKVKIIEGGQSGLLRGELIDLDWIKMVNKGIQSQKAEYEPVILGITKAALETESFISAASFQETTRILARAAIERKTDFLRGLKENVILGHLIPAGTGFSLSFNPQSADYSTQKENVKFFRNLCLGLTKIDS